MKFTLKQAANYRGVSRKEIADKLNVTVNTVTSWFTMNRIPRFDQAIEICELLNFPLEDIIFYRKKVDLKSKKEAKEN